MDIQDLLSKLNGFKEGDDLEQGKGWLNQLLEQVKQFAPNLDIDLNNVKDFSSFSQVFEKLKANVGGGEGGLGDIADKAKNLFGGGGKGLFG
jgi:hypothetical protein